MSVSSVFLKIAGEGCDVCLSVLSRRCAGLFHGLVNCAPAQCCVWPVLAPAQAWVHAGLGDGVMRSYCNVSRLGLRLLYVSIGRSCVRFTPAVCRARQTGTACDRLRFCSAWVEIAAYRVLKGRTVIGRIGFTSGLCVSLRRSRRENGVDGAAKYFFAKTHYPCYSFHGEYVGGCALPNLCQEDWFP